MMVVTCAGVAGSTALALVAAARQTSGRVVCILNSLDCYNASKKALGNYGDCINFVIGDAKRLLINDYKSADFVLVDCNSSDHKGVLRAAQEGTANHGGALILGYNALHMGPYWSDTDEFKTHFLPIGEGLLVIRKGASTTKAGTNHHGLDCRKRSRWVVKIDKWTGEEHVFRISSPLPEEIKA
ncbi:hypothetical protein PTKIN_Ptkin15bG0025500 [Pterospermum kingtungense]